MTASSVFTFSVVTPSYNQGEFIEETIKSVLSQEGDFAIDYLIMDGGSTDESVEIIRKYDLLLKEGQWPLKCRDISYRWVSERDKGQVDAIEKGFAQATGEIGCWLNSDDVFHDVRVLDRVAKVFAADPALEVVTGDGTFIDKKGNEFGVHQVHTLNLDELIYLDYHILQPATFLKDSIYKQERLDLAYNYCFDAEYFIRLLHNGHRFKKLDDKLACFRLYPETKTLHGLGKRYAESLRIAKRYRGNHLHYAISSLYKYFDIVLTNKYPESRIVRHGRRLMQALAYLMITGRTYR